MSDGDRLTAPPPRFPLRYRLLRKLQNYFSCKVQILLHPADILSPILCQAHVSLDQVVVDHRVGMWWSPSRPPAVVVATWLKGHHRGMAPGVTPTARLGHPVQVHCGPLKPISCDPISSMWPRMTYPLNPQRSVESCTVCPRKTYDMNDPIDVIEWQNWHDLRSPIPPKKTR